jgi:hypothetical protein
MFVKTKKFWIPASLFVAALAAVAQGQPELTARELFYIPVSNSPLKPVSQTKPTAPPAARRSEPGAVAAKKNTQPTPATEPAPARPEPGWGEVKLVTASYSGNKPLGLRYSLYEYEKIGSRWNAEEVSPDKTFRTGDRVQIQVESNEDGYLYIIQRGTSGDWTVLFPAKEINGGKNRVTAMEPVRIPNGRAFFTFSGKPGTEKLFIVLARKPVADVEEMILDLNRGRAPAAAAPESPKPEPKKAEPKKTSTPGREGKGPTLLAQAISPIDDPLTGRHRNQMLARDLVFEKVDSDGADSPKDKSVYVVDKSGRADANFIVELPLKHQ